VLDEVSAAILGGVAAENLAFTRARPLRVGCKALFGCLVSSTEIARTSQKLMSHQPTARLGSFSRRPLESFR
jgi:hypothetical protein